MKPQYLTTSDIANLCDVNPATVADWANRKGLPHIRTPGGHRRFKPRELVPWLREKGYDIPLRLLAAAVVDASDGDKPAPEAPPGPRAA